MPLALVSVGLPVLPRHSMGAYVKKIVFLHMHKTAGSDIVAQLYQSRFPAVGAKRVSPHTIRHTTAT